MDKRIEDALHAASRILRHPEEGWDEEGLPTEQCTAALALIQSALSAVSK